jgi:2-dehydro-3-deoxyphosphogluconate aldolase/(4S)-4-hydroxy-2-oxoglutarate aldolase
VLTVHHVADAVPLARALARGGIRAIEVTLRTPVALQAIGEIARGVPEVRVGAGTVRSPAELDAALSAGAAFAVSPGQGPELLRAAAGTPVPFVPGVATASDVMACLTAGFRELKLFPAAAAGGLPLLRSLAAPFPEVAFCPTGGITAANAQAYLDDPAVFAVGGSWLAPDAAVQAGDWGRVEALAAESARRLSGAGPGKG